MNWHQVRVVARTDLRQLRQSPDFWVPMVVLGSVFFVVAPALLLWIFTHVRETSVLHRVSTTLQLLPRHARSAVQGVRPEGRVAYTLSVYLFAPLAVIVPMTISTAVGANTIVGEKERGTGEFLAHSPAGEREIYLGKLVASLVPGYLTTVVGFGVYALVVNLVAGPSVGRWFFPTGDWWLLMFWVVPPFLALTLSVVLRLSARVRSAAAAQQASGLVTLPLIAVAYAESSGAVGGGARSAVVLGLASWAIAAAGLVRGSRAVTRARLLGS